MKLHKHSAVALLLLISLLLSCAPKRYSVTDELITVLGESVKILEKHRDTPHKGILQFKAFLKRQGPKISLLKQEIESQKATLSPDHKISLEKYYQKKMDRINQRLNKISPLYQKSFQGFETLSAPQQVQPALP